MAGPYGIEQVNVPGILAGAEQMRQNRIQSMLLQRRIAQEEREAETQAGVRAAFARYRGQDAAGSPGATVTPPASSGGGVPSASPALPASAPATMTARQPTAADRERLFSELLALDTQVASQAMQAFQNMDEAQQREVDRRNTRVMRVAGSIMQIPESDMAGRIAALQEAAPELLEVFTQEQIANFQPTDVNLRRVFATTLDQERMLQFVQPNLRNVGPGDVLIDERNPTGRPVYESPYIEGPDGRIYRREGTPAGPPQPGQVVNGYRFRGGDLRDRNNWEPVQGGAGQPGPQTFP